MQLTPEKLALLKRLVDHASPLPCRTGRSIFRTIYSGTNVIGMLDRAEDAAFFVAAREAVPELIEEVERLREELRAILQGS